VPASGEQLVIGDFRVVVEQVIKRRVKRVFFERLEPAPSAPASREAE
jgi:CBS domain containing-hemolysin-like protein